MNQEAQGQKMAQIIAKCWADPAFKAKLRADPAAVLQAEGLAVPAGLRLRVVEDTPQCVHWVLPARPMDLSDDELDQVAGGMTISVSPHPVVSGSYFLVASKPVGTRNQASVVWTSFNPFNRTAIDWTETYEVYAR